jgi:hypothetical protein
MQQNSNSSANGMPFDRVEPQLSLLKQPPNNQKLYKVMTIENFIRSISGNYLHFQRVDTYKDFPGADESDGEQLPLDKSGNQGSKFAKDPTYTAATYYDSCRARTYAYCLSLENSDYIWKEYGNKEGSKGKVCVVFEFEKLRQILNQTINDSSLMYGNVVLHQFFSINHGIVEYVKRAEHRLNHEHLPNPIQYAYLKEEERYGQEKELRISLSAMGIGKFVLNDRGTIQFLPSLQLQFNFKAAFSNGTIEHVLHTDPAIVSFLQKEMERLGFF